MPNIRSQDVTGGSLTLVGSDGRTVTVTSQQLRARFVAETGTVAQRRAASMSWVKAQIEAALGPENVSQTVIDLDFTQADGRMSLLVLRSA